MHELTTGRPARGRNTLALICLLAVATVTVGCSRDTDEDPAATTPDVVTVSPDPTDGPKQPRATDTPSNGPGEGNDPQPGPAVDLTPQEREDVEERTEDYYDDQTDILEDPGEDAPDPDDFPHVTGDALAALVNQVAEFQHSGWRLAGEPEVVWQRVVRATTDPEGVVVRACVDNSDVRVLDRNGDEVPNSRPSTTRTLNILTVVRVGDDWKVSDHALARRPDC